MESPKRFNKSIIFGGIISVLALVAIGAAIYFYLQYKTAQDNIMHPTKAAEAEARQLISSLTKLMMLPTDEDPTIASVADREKLQGQAFFANAANGDKVFMYVKNKKAILYRPSLNKIIEVAPFSINASGSAAKPPEPTAAVKGDATTGVIIALRNGTAVASLTKKFETVLASKVPGSTIVDRAAAAKTDYAKTFIFDLTGAKGDQVAQLASELGIIVGALPKDEHVDNLVGKADFLIIIGADKK